MLIYPICLESIVGDLYYVSLLQEVDEEKAGVAIEFDGTSLE